MACRCSPTPGPPSSNAPAPSASRCPISAEQYQRFAALRGEWLTAAATRIPLASLATQARALLLWDGKRVVPGNEVQRAMVLDLGVFSPVGGHTSAWERQARAVRPEDGDAAGFFAACAQARFGLFRLAGRDPRGGLRLEDAADGGEVWLRDAALDQRGVTGMFFGARLLRPADFAMTCGLLVPVDHRVLRIVLEQLPPHRGPVHPRPEPQPDDPELAALLAEAGARDQLRAMLPQPAFVARLYRAALDVGLVGAVPGREPPAA